MGTILVTGLREMGIHGVLPEERQHSQPFEVDLELTVDLAAAAASDDLDDTVDYGAVVEAVRRIVAEERFALLERLAARIAEICTADPRVRGAVVTVRKLRPPVRGQVDHVGVRYEVTAPSAPRRCYLGLGSNVGDRAAQLRGALRALEAEPGVEVVGVSAVYETEPVGGPPQDEYLNAVVALETSSSARELLALAQRLEDGAGRVRTQRWGPRTLDVDVLIVGDEVVDAPDLVVPHPRLGERAFVLAPLHDLAPDLAPRPPGGWEGVRRTGIRWDDRHPESGTREAGLEREDRNVGRRRARGRGTRP